MIHQNRPLFILVHQVEYGSLRSLRCFYFTFPILFYQAVRFQYHVNFIQVLCKYYAITIQVLCISGFLDFLVFLVVSFFVMFIISIRVSYISKNKHDIHLFLDKFSRSSFDFFIWNIVLLSSPAFTEMLDFSFCELKFRIWILCQIYLPHFQKLIKNYWPLVVSCRGLVSRCS